MAFILRWCSKSFRNEVHLTLILRISEEKPHGDAIESTKKFVIHNGTKKFFIMSK